MVRNGYGDGKTTVAIFNEKNQYTSAIDNMMEYQCLIDGKFNIYNYDCDEEEALELEGRYLVYSYNGFVVLINEK